MKPIKQYRQTFFLTLLLLFVHCCANSQPAKPIVGAEQPEKYISYISGKRVALMVNHTSMVDTVHLVDFLLERDIDVVKIFAVEHGFRGNVAYGELFDNEIDQQTGIPIVSLYGERKKALPSDFEGVDVAIFDMQDVGCRFYTYISSMHYLMEACAENNIPLLVLDRPNPNGDYVDGPVLQRGFESFVGMHPIPVVHACTVGELALMINAEGWLKNGVSCNLRVIKVENYTHNTAYSLPVRPSPNLPNDLAVRLYPSLCFFEATNVSIGRGTEFPFQVIGFPGCQIDEIVFTPRPIEGFSNNPLFKDETCSGTDLRNLTERPQFTLRYFLLYMNQFEKHSDFWKSKRWMSLLSGSEQLYQQMNEGFTEEQIKESWQPEIIRYKVLRKKYLLYVDFE